MTPISLSPQGSRDEHPWYTYRWPWLVMSGPALVVVAASFSGWLAFSRQDQMVVDDYYMQGLQINQDLRRDSAASALALTFGGHYSPVTESFDGTLSSHGLPLSGTVAIRLRHATDPKKDRSVLTQVDRSGRFSVVLPLLEQSRWNLVVEDQRGRWRLGGIWQWPQSSDVALHADIPAEKG